MSNELAPIDRDLAIVEKLSAFAKLAQSMPHLSTKKPGEILMLLMKGREMNMSPIESLEQLYTVNGRPTLSADSRNRMIRKHGHKVEIVEWTSRICKLRGIRKGEEKGEEVTYSMDDATIAGLTSKDNWKKHPKEMLFARCISILQRVVFPDVTSSVIYDADELEEFKDTKREPAPMQEAMVEIIEEKISIQDAKALVARWSYCPKEFVERSEKYLREEAKVYRLIDMPLKLFKPMFDKAGKNMGELSGAQATSEFMEALNETQS